MIKILFLTANPLDTQPLRLDEEMHAIDSALRQGEFRDGFDIRSQWAVRISDLQELLLRHQPHIVHFSGHGSDSSEIILQSEEGTGVSIPAEALSDLFRVLKDNIRCVVPNACYSSEQGEGIGVHIDSVIGISDAITDQASIQFATSLYRALGYGRTVETAFDLACNQLDLYGLEEAHKPQLVGNKDPSLITFVSNEEQESKSVQIALRNQVNTDGGAYIGGSVNVEGGGFVGRDQVVTNYSAADSQQHFAELLDTVKQSAKPEQQAKAVQQVLEIQAEVSKGNNADDSRLAALIDELIALVPGAVSAVVSSFATPILGGLTGPVTKFVLDKLAKQDD